MKYDQLRLAYNGKVYRTMDIEGLRKSFDEQLDLVVATVERCDNILGNELTAQGHKIKALEEAICPRVAARLTALEKAVKSLSQQADTKPAQPTFYAIQYAGIGYSMLELDVAIEIAADQKNYDVVAQLPLARRLVKRVQGNL